MFSKYVDVAMAVKIYKYYAGYYAGWCDKIKGRTIPIIGPYFCYTSKEPVGVCG